jgi:hypothetical protein
MTAMTKNRNIFKWTHFWKRTTQGSFQQSLVEIGSVVSEEKIFLKFHHPFFLICIRKKANEMKKISSPLKLQSQSQPNFAEMIFVWSPFKIVSVSAVLYPRWPPWLKIEISSNGQKIFF